MSFKRTLNENVIKSFKGAFFQAGLKKETIDVYKMMDEATKLWPLTHHEAWDYLKALEKEGFIFIEPAKCFRTRYAWMIADMQLGSAYY